MQTSGSARESANTHECQARSSTETIGGDPVRRRLVHKTRPERERPQLDDDSEPADKYQRVEMVDYDAPGLGGERKKMTLRPPEEYDIEDDTKEIEVDDLDMTEVLKLAQNEGLDPSAVEAGIRQELKGLQDFGVYQEISEKEVKEQGLKVIDARLVIKERADGVKARLCAKDFAHTKRGDLYVPTPSPAIVRTLLTRAHRRAWITNLIDFVQAILQAPTDDDKVILRPPRSVRRQGWLWTLKKALCGLRVAPQKFHDWLADLLLSIGFRQMVGHPAYFRHDEKDVEIVIHIDDGIVAGQSAQVTEIQIDTSRKGGHERLRWH